MALPSFVVLLVLLAWSCPALAVQATGALVLMPSKQLGLVAGEEFALTVLIENGSTDTPAADFPDEDVSPVAATLRGPVTVQLGCTDVACTEIRRGALSFVAGPGAGCVSKHPGVAGCSVDVDSGAVTIDVGADGIPVPGASSVELAVIGLKVSAESAPPLGIRGTSLVDGLRACSSAVPSICAAVLLQGNTFVTQQQGGHGGGKTRVTIRFRGDSSTPDQLDFDGRIVLEGSVNLSDVSFSVELANAVVGTIFKHELPRGALVKGKFVDRTAKATGGIAKLVIKPVRNEPGVFRIQIQCFDPNIERATTLPADVPDMVFGLAVGADAFSAGVTFERKSYGWLAIISQ